MQLLYQEEDTSFMAKEDHDGHRRWSGYDPRALPLLRTAEGMATTAWIGEDRNLLWYC